MYRFLLRTANAARNSGVGVYEWRVLSAKCDTAVVFRVGNEAGVKSISTCSVKFCEKKPDVILSGQDEKTQDDRDEKADPSVVAQKAGQDRTDIKMAEQREELIVLKTDDESSVQQQVDVKIDQSAAKPSQVKINTAKSGKENLLDLLGAMKVDVTNKRKLKIMKAKQNYVSAPKSHPAVMESTISMFQKATEQGSSHSTTLDPELVAAASAAASTLPNRSLAESELLKQLRKHEAITEAQKKGDMKDLGVIIADMKVGKNPKRFNARQTNQIQFDDDEERGYTQSRGITAELGGIQRRNLFRVKRLNIFSPKTDEAGVESAVAQPTLWDIDFANQLSLSINQMPRNALEELIQWTKEGKMWQYPVNNEAGLEEEASVPFHEHVFLEKHLNEGFPSKGPVRHFMELVVTGLSSNPYLTVQQKREHISWFRDYFQQKEDVLREAEVLN
ncbi:small ribosomal subunit protein mS31 [Echeneis naucrates]|uniref:small ribosomal subunit protein mS31 n=1 Tax=Echeneis naucrates TaxID=173247 RepID=UPI0011135983|nr:28S ribosomal protein S31, mitochondrial [Echeneis naucrates]